MVRRQKSGRMEVGIFMLASPFRVITKLRLCLLIWASGMESSILRTERVKELSAYRNMIFITLKYVLYLN